VTRQEAVGKLLNLAGVLIYPLLKRWWANYQQWLPHAFITCSLCQLVANGKNPKQSQMMISVHMRDQHNLDPLYNLANAQPDPFSASMVSVQKNWT